MKSQRTLGVVALGIVACLAIAGAGYFFAHRAGGGFGGSVVVFYTKDDGESLGKWTISLSPSARDLASVAFYATAQEVAGPPPDVVAVRFPSGTIVRSARVSGTVATVDLAGAVAAPQSGSYAESGEFKALVWTLTELPGVSAVQVKVDGARVPTLPGGHLELDEPLTRKSW